MRLWHQDLLHYLDDKRLLAQHRECCALRGKAWGKKHSIVNYVFNNPYSSLFYYHMQVINELRARHFKIDIKWEIHNYHGKKLNFAKSNDIRFFTSMRDHLRSHCNQKFPIMTSKGIVIAYPKMAYNEHNDAYLRQCIDNLKSKGAELVNGKSLAEFELILSIIGV